MLSKLTTSLQKAVQLDQEKGASTWLTALPTQEHGFSLHKTAFCKALAFAIWLVTFSHAFMEIAFQLIMSKGWFFFSSS